MSSKYDHHVHTLRARFRNGVTLDLLGQTDTNRPYGIKGEKPVYGYTLDKCVINAFSS